LEDLLDSPEFRAELDRRQRHAASGAGFRAYLVWRELYGPHDPHDPISVRSFGFPSKVDFYALLPDPRDLQTLVARYDLVRRVQQGSREARDMVLGLRLLLEIPRKRGARAVKRQLVRRLSRGELSEEERASLREQALRAFDRGQGTPWWEYVPLVRRLDGPELRAALAERMGSEQERVRARAERMLQACTR
jgi:hypothetical protein